MNQIEFHKFFKSPGPVILPVVHVLDEKQATRNVALAIRAGAPGVLLINHDISREAFVPLIRTVRARFPTLWLGVNGVYTVTQALTHAVETGGDVVFTFGADVLRIDDVTVADIQSHITIL